MKYRGIIRFIESLRYNGPLNLLMQALDNMGLEGLLENGFLFTYQTEHKILVNNTSSTICKVSIVVYPNAVF